MAIQVFFLKADNSRGILLLELIPLAGPLLFHCIAPSNSPIRPIQHVSYAARCSKLHIVRAGAMTTDDGNDGPHRQQPTEPSPLPP